MNSRVIGVRFPLSDVKKLKELCVSRGESISAFIRRVVYLEMGKIEKMEGNSERSRKKNT